MKILEMTATFGCLNHAVLRPGEGFTLVEASNESGKSTWCAFLRAMLYGFPDRDRDKKGYIAEKNRYQPWSGAPMEGSLVLDWNGRSITLYRGAKGTTPWGAFSATYTATGETVPELTADTCGETLLGISREVFERTAFIAQGQITLSPSADLEKRAAALASSGEEDVSFSQVERRLKDWLNRRKSNARNGLIPQLEGELRELADAEAQQGELLRRYEEALQKRETLAQQREELNRKLSAHTAYQEQQLSSRREKAQQDYDLLLARVEQLAKVAETLPAEEELRQAQGDLSYLNTLTANLRSADKAAPDALAKAREAEECADHDTWFGNMDTHYAALQAQKDRDEAEKLGKGVPLLLSLLGGLAGAAVGYFVKLPALSGQLGAILETPYLVAAVGAVLGWLICFIPLFCLHRKRKKRAAAILERYEVTSPEEILTRSADYAKKVETAQNLRRAFQEVESERAKLLNQKDELTANLLTFVHGFAPEVSDLFGVSAALSRALHQGESYRMAENDLHAAQKLLSALPAPSSVAAGLLTVTPSAEDGSPDELQRELKETEAALTQAERLSSQLYGELTALGDPARREGQRASLSRELARRQEEYDALTEALAALKAADSQLQERFSPAINQRTGAYLARLTEGKYDQASLTRQFQAMARESGNPALRQDLTLSGGAAQQLYLAARLAMCELALPADQPCPILLDDALDAFDDTRAQAALDCLLELAEQRQVILFTCHSREKKMLNGQAVTIAELGATVAI